MLESLSALSTLTHLAFKMVPCSNISIIRHDLENSPAIANVNKRELRIQKDLNMAAPKASTVVIDICIYIQVSYY